MLTLATVLATPILAATIMKSHKLTLGVKSWLQSFSDALCTLQPKNASFWRFLSEAGLLMLHSQILVT